MGPRITSIRASPEVIELAGLLPWSAREDTSRQPSKRAAALYRPERFNERVFINGFEVKPTTGTLNHMWAGPPSALQPDAAKAYKSGTWEQVVLEHSQYQAGNKAQWSVAYWCLGVCLCQAQDAQLTDMDSYMDNPQIWTAKVKYAINSRVREGEFIYPYKFATGTIKSTKRRNAQRTRSASPGNSSRSGDSCS